jgi:hypothetical protein
MYKAGTSIPRKGQRQWQQSFHIQSGAMPVRNIAPGFSLPWRWEPNLTAAGIAQLLTGVINFGQFIGMTVPFVILMLIAIWLTIVLFRNFVESMTPQEARARVAHA